MKQSKKKSENVACTAVARAPLFEMDTTALKIPEQKSGNNGPLKRIIATVTDCPVSAICKGLPHELQHS